MASPSLPQLIPPPTQIDDTHKVYSVALACILLGIVASMFVLLRLGQRIHSRTFGNDDYAIIPALLLYIGWTAMAGAVNLNAGVGKPLWEITLGEYSVWFKGIIGSVWLYPAMTASIRISILLFYQRMFATSLNRAKFAIWLLLALQIVYLVVFSILPAFICKPLYKAFEPLEREMYMNDWYYYYTQVALYSVSMAFDVILLVMPLYPVFKLQMPMKRRIGVALMFMLGAAASIAAAYKLAIFVTQMQRFTAINPRWLQYQMSMLIPPQFDQYGTTFWIPSQVEPTVALIGASLPAIRHFMGTTAKQVFTSSSSKFKQSSGSTDRTDQSGSQRSRVRNLRRNSDSEVGLRSEYLELNSSTKAFAK
ncbi:hypothetical protein MMC30_004803 [Trapelia coarctata]|nr:hypothetical protein [Trapelia coarctata]